MADNVESAPIYITDFQWFGRALSEQEISDITSCKSFAKGIKIIGLETNKLYFLTQGDIYSFNTDDWVVFDKELQKNEAYKVQYRVVELDKSTLCNVENKYTFFPDEYKHLDGSQLCKRFGGRRADVSSKKKFDEVVAYLATIKEDPAWTENLAVTTYTMLTDEEEFNVWKNYETGELPEDPLNWAFGEPNGGMVENCAQIWISKDEQGRWVGSYNDQTCTKPTPVACQDIGEVLLTLRGIVLGRMVILDIMPVLLIKTITETLKAIIAILQMYNHQLSKYGGCQKHPEGVFLVFRGGGLQTTFSIFGGTRPFSKFRGW